MSPIYTALNGDEGLMDAKNSPCRAIHLVEALVCSMPSGILLVPRNVRTNLSHQKKLYRPRFLLD